MPSIFHHTHQFGRLLYLPAPWSWTLQSWVVRWEYRDMNAFSSKDILWNADKWNFRQSEEAAAVIRQTVQDSGTYQHILLTFHFSFRSWHRKLQHLHQYTEFNLPIQLLLPIKRHTFRRRRKRPPVTQPQLPHFSQLLQLPRMWILCSYFHL